MLFIFLIGNVIYLMKMLFIFNYENGINVFEIVLWIGIVRYVLETLYMSWKCELIYWKFWL